MFGSNVGLVLLNGCGSSSSGMSSSWKAKKQPNYRHSILLKQIKTTIKDKIKFRKMYSLNHEVPAQKTDEAFTTTQNAKHLKLEQINHKKRINILVHFSMISIVSINVQQSLSSWIIRRKY